MDQLRILEYKKDIYHYYTTAYGSEANRRMGCGALKNMITQLDTTKATMFFGHQSIVKVFLTTLGAFEDKVPLTAENYGKLDNRLWKTSIISPFAANFAAVKYKGDKIRCFQNGRIVKMDWCSKDGECDWKVAKEKFKAKCPA